MMHGPINIRFTVIRLCYIQRNLRVLQGDPGGNVNIYGGNFIVNSEKHFFMSMHLIMSSYRDREQLQG